jgi:hypothetical protein
MGTAIYWDDTAYLRWRYNFGSEVQGRGDCWVLVLDGRIAGMVGTERVELRRGEETVPAWLTMDIAVAPYYEGSGLGSWMNLRICQAAGCALTIGSNEKSRNMIIRTFRLLPGRRSYVLPIRFRRLLNKRLRSQWLARAAAVLADAVAAVWRRLAFIPTDAELELRSISRFDDSARELLANGTEPDERWIVRSIEFLNWRLFDNPRVRYQVIGAYRKGILLGFMASMHRGRRGEPPGVVLVDWLVDRAYFKPVFRTLCANAVGKAAAGEAETIAVTAYHDRSERLLKRFGFIARHNQYETLAVYATDEALLASLLTPGPWFITEANADRDDL